jgi:hypothetical protein
MIMVVMVPVARVVAVVSGAVIATPGNGEASEHQGRNQRELAHLFSPMMASQRPESPRGSLGADVVGLDRSQAFVAIHSSRAGAMVLRHLPPLKMP